MKLDEIKANYENMSTLELLELLKQIDLLREDAKKVLFQELIKRGEQDAIQKTKDQIEQSKRNTAQTQDDPLDRKRNRAYDFSPYVPENSLGAAESGPDEKQKYDHFREFLRAKNSKNVTTDLQTFRTQYEITDEELRGLIRKAHHRSLVSGAILLLDLVYLLWKFNRIADFDFSRAENITELYRLIIAGVIFIVSLYYFFKFRENLSKIGIR